MMFCWPILVVVVIVTIVTEPPCQRINREEVGSSVLRAHRHDKPSASYDLNVGPSIRHQL